MSKRMVYMIRHGQTDWNVAGRIQGSSDIPLNAVGEQQALLAAENLRPYCENIRCVVVSPLIRARRTAEIITGALGLPEPIVDARIQERCFGLCEGMTWDEVREQFIEYTAWEKRDPRFSCTEGGETYQDVIVRFTAALQDHIAHSEGDILVVSHGGCIGSFLAAMHATNLRDMFTDYKAQTGNACVAMAEVRRVLQLSPGQ